MHEQHWTDYKISLYVCHCVSESVTQNELNALQVAIFHRSSPNLPSWQCPRRYNHLLFLVEIWNTYVRQPEVEFIFTIAAMEKYV